MTHPLHSRFAHARRPRLAPALRTLFVTAIAVTATNCTYGQVTWGGTPKANAYVSISNCDAESWNTYTNSSGWYSHDGYADSDEFIPEGLVLIMTRIGTIEKFDMSFIKYGPCPDDPDKLCDREDIDWGFQPMSGWEWNAWYDWLETSNTNDIYDFFAFCGAGVGAKDSSPHRGPKQASGARRASLSAATDENTAIGRALAQLGDKLDYVLTDYEPSRALADVPTLPPPPADSATTKLR